MSDNAEPGPPQPRRKRRAPAKASPGEGAGILGYLKGVQKVLAVGAGFATIPLFLSFAKLEPPTPPAIGYVSAALVVLAALIAWEWTRRAARDTRRWMIIGAAVLTIVGLVSYIYLHSMYIEQVPGTSQRIVRGNVCNGNALILYRDRCPDVPSSALEDVGWDTREIWTRRSITNVEVSLVAAWLTFTAGLIAAVGAVIAGRKL